MLPRTHLRIRGGRLYAGPVPFLALSGRILEVLQSVGSRTSRERVGSVRKVHASSAQRGREEGPAVPKKDFERRARQSLPPPGQRDGAHHAEIERRGARRG